MKNKVLKILFGFIVFFASSTSTIGVEAAVGTKPSVQYSSSLSSTYYSSVEGKTGTSLLSGLATLTRNNHKHYTTYAELEGGCVLSDKAPSNSSKFVDFYSGLLIANDWNSDLWNREHLWCQSNSGGLFGETGAGADIHHIRPLLKSINSSRNNKKYGKVSSRDSNKKYYDSSTNKISTSGTHWGYMNTSCYEPLDKQKGDVARIIMYVYMHYSKEVSTNSSFNLAGSLDITNIVYTSSGTKDAAFDLLVDWCESDPVDTFEMNRNNYCASVTGTRNPFIDHPEYANAIWGDGTLDSGSSEGSGSDSGNTESGSGTPGSGTSGTIGESTDGGSVTIGGESTNKTVYRRLKSATGINEGDKIIIVTSNSYSGGYYALNDNLKSNGCFGRSAVSKRVSGSDVYIDDPKGANIFTVGTASTIDSKKYYPLKGSGGYIATSSNNVLQEKTTGTSNNSKWNFSFSNDGASCTIKAGGSYTYNQIRHGSSEFGLYKDNTTGTDVEVYQAETITTSTPSTTYNFPQTNTLLSLSKANEVASYASYTTSGFTPGTYLVEGTISNIENSTYGNMTITDGSNSLYVYGVYGDNGSLQFSDLSSVDQPKVGDKIKLCGVLGTYNGQKEMKNAYIVGLEKGTSASQELKSLLDKYVGDGIYTKKTVINLNEAAQTDIRKYFFTGNISLKRTTYYYGNALLMANYDGSVKGVDSTSGINSGYGTDSSGNMTHFTLNSDGSKSIDYTVEVNGGMEGFYVTPKDFASNNYFSTGWVYEPGIGYVYDYMKSGNTNQTYLKDFVNVAAPLLLDLVYTSNYLQISKLIVTESNNSLVLRILADQTNSGVLSNLVSTKLCVAEAVITSGSKYTL